MNWLTTVLAGAAGGLVVELVALLTNLNEYRQARKKARASRKAVLPHWNRYIDPKPDSAVAATRLVLGAIAGAFFHGQVTTMLAAVAVGAAAPTLLGQIGSARTMGELNELTDQKKTQ